MRDEESLMYPPMEVLLDKIPDKYALVLTATKRAKHIILQKRLNPNAEGMQDDRKPLSIALKEIAEGVVNQSDLDLPELLMDDYVDDELPVYTDLSLPIEKEVVPEVEVEFGVDAVVDESKDVVEDLDDVDDIPGLDLDSDD